MWSTLEWVIMNFLILIKMLIPFYHIHTQACMKVEVSSPLFGARKYKNTVKSEKHYLIQLRVLMHGEHKWIILISFLRINESFWLINALILYSQIKWRSALFIVNLERKGSKGLAQNRIKIRSKFQVGNKKSWSQLYLRVFVPWSLYNNIWIRFQIQKTFLCFSFFRK